MRSCASLRQEMSFHVINAHFLLCFMILASGLLAGCSAGQPPTPVPPRESAIPAGAVKMSPETDAFLPILHLAEWENPVPLAGAINTAGAEDSPFITSDGSTFYFFFTPDPSIPAEKQLLDGVTGIYVSRWQNDTWGQAERLLLQEPGKLGLDGCPFVQGTTLWFCSTREGYTGIHWFTAQYQEQGWVNWQLADGAFPQDYEVGELHIAPDGKALYYHSARAGGKGDLDIWVTRLQDGAWQSPENVAAVNSPEAEGWPFVSQDGQELWFTRFYLGSPAVYRSKWNGSGWAEPELVVSQFAGEPTLDAQGNLYFVHHYFLDRKMVEADIYAAYRK